MIRNKPDHSFEFGARELDTCQSFDDTAISPSGFLLGRLQSNVSSS